MAPSSSPDSSPESSPADGLGPGDGDRLLDIAEHAIRAGLRGVRPAPPTVADVEPALRRQVGTFVTLHVGGELNGCIGSIDPTEPLAHSVARHAWASAFDDPRLPPLTVDDYEQLALEISILSPLTLLPAADRAGLIAALRPHVDGLVIEVAPRRAVFLPSVWEAIPEPDRFLAELLAKAGLDRDWWGPELRASTFTVAQLHRGPADGAPTNPLSAPPDPAG